MDKLCKFIDINVPMTTCNFRCKYCYITQKRLFHGCTLEFKYSPSEFKQGFSIEKLGGYCLLNFCASGETLLSLNILPYIYNVLELGHYCMIVTNGTSTKALDELCTWPADFRERLFIKFSYHYEQLKAKKLFDNYFKNINKIRQAGISFTVELVPNDEQIQYINEIKEQTLIELGALCHVTVPRNEQTSELKILTNLDKNDFYNIWKSFNSQLFEYKFNIFGKKQTSTCSAGKCTFFCKMTTDSCQLYPCYSSKPIQNLLDKKINKLQLKPITKCPFAHCYNGHAFLVLGNIQNPAPYTYDMLRNRACTDGTEWIQPRMKAFMQQHTI